MYWSDSLLKVSNTELEKELRCILFRAFHLFYEFFLQPIVLIFGPKPFHTPPLEICGGVSCTMPFLVPLSDVNDGR